MQCPVYSRYIGSAQGLVEIFWRGKTDYHCTMRSYSSEEATRWGTSIQLTTKGANAADRFWQLGRFSKIITPADRLRNHKHSKVSFECYFFDLC